MGEGDFVLAIDQGTSASKALVLARNGSFRMLPAMAHTTRYPKPGWVEQDPQELLANIAGLLEWGLKTTPGLAALGLDNQGETVVAWDRQSGVPLYAAIVWQDSRTQDRIEALKAAGQEELIRERAGLPLDSYFSATKLAWLWDNLPEARALARSGRLGLGTSDSYFLERLSGRYITDATTAARTSLMNLTSLAWDPELCALFGVPIEHLPEIVPTIGALGEVAVESARLPLCAAIVDQQAALYGHACRQAGDVKITFGTGAFALALTGQERPEALPGGLLATLAWLFPEEGPYYALDGGIATAAAALNWVKRLGLFQSFREIGHFTAAPAIERGLVFVPALSGLACPFWDRSAAGLWLGLTLASENKDLVQAVLEGVALRMGQVFATFKEASGTTPTRVSVDGGMSLNPYFQTFLAEILDTELQVTTIKDITAYGTALLAARGAGWQTPPGAEAALKSHRVAPSGRGQGKVWQARFDEALGRSRGWWQA